MASMAAGKSPANTLRDDLNAASPELFHPGGAGLPIGLIDLVKTADRRSTV